MEFLERYLQAVRFWLPKAQQNDMIEELHDDLRSQVEDRESSLGRTLSEDEMVAFLRQTGHPLQVAAKYQPQQSLIGPMLFPLYKFVLKIVALGYLAPWVLVWASLMLFWPAYRAQHQGIIGFLAPWSSFWSLTFALFGVITIVFAVLERFHGKLSFMENWDPRKLPRASQRKARVSRVQTIFELVLSVIFVVWWLGLPGYGHWIFGVLGGAFTLNPALHGFFLPMLMPTLLLIVQQCINLVRPQWLWLRPIAAMIADVIALVIFGLLARVSPYLIGASGSSVHYAQGLSVANQVVLWSVLGFLAGIVIALAVHVFQTIQELRRMDKSKPRTAALQAL